LFPFPESLRVIPNFHQDVIDIKNRWATAPRYDLNRSAIQGSPFLDDAFIPAKVYLNNKLESDLLARYNVFDDVVEVQYENKLYEIAPDTSIHKIVIGTTVLVVARFKEGYKVWDGFLESLDQGKLSIFAKKVVVYQDLGTPGAESPRTPKKFFRRNDVYYFSIDDGEIVELNSMKKLLNLLPGKKKETAAFAKAEKIEIKSADLIKIADFYNSLFDGAGD
jgi:hypothetical protein